MSVKGKKILLAVTGSIAAYKSATLIRDIIKAGAEVKVIMTEAATKFISPLTLSVLSKNEVHQDLFTEGTWHNHVELGMWADAMIVAPCTAATLSKMSTGHCDNMVLACYLSAKCPVFFAPAMDLDMWAHPSTQSNIDTLTSYGNILIPVGNGELASGLSGDGRMAEPHEIIGLLQDFFSAEKPLSEKKIVITAGPTYEHIDPVRFIGNHSTGKMGIALAERCASLGGIVTLVLGPTHLRPSHTQNIEVVPVMSAQEMEAKTVSAFMKADVAILSAAVADYRPVTMQEKKIKKEGNAMSVALIKNPDIAASLGSMKTAQQITIGFALETHDEVNNAIKKIEKKNFDFIVLNSLKDKGAGFGHDTNKVSIIHKDGHKKQFPLKSKKEVAADIIEELLRIIG